MIRFAFRQFRTSAIAAGATLAVLVITVALTGPNLAHLYDTSSIPTCSRYQDCGQLGAAFLLHDAFLEALLNFVVIVTPAIIGIFFGAPLIARELESGTFRLAWAQGVSRTRWLLSKLAVVGLASMVCAAVVSVAVTWFSSPIDRVNMSPFQTFDNRDLVPIGYAAFAFALGTALGMLIRRVLPTMAATLVGFVALRLVVYHWVRPHLISPIQVATGFQVQISNGPGPAGSGSALSSADWVLSNQTINAAGRVIGENGSIGSNGNLGLSVSPNGQVSIPGAGICRGIKIPSVQSPGSSGSISDPARVQAEFHTCITSLHLRELLTYQPASRYWPFQLYETGIFIAVALVLSSFCLWWIRHRLV
jgi:ABC-2 family transporter protein